MTPCATTSLLGARRLLRLLRIPADGARRDQVNEKKTGIHVEPYKLRLRSRSEFRAADLYCLTNLSKSPHRPDTGPRSRPFLSTQRFSPSGGRGLLSNRIQPRRAHESTHNQIRLAFWTLWRAQAIIAAHAPYAEAKARVRAAPRRRLVPL
jgi:hypothetical protein